MAAETAGYERALLQQQLREAIADCDRERVSQVAQALARLGMREREERRGD
jgi:hypothetical protein